MNSLSLNNNGSTVNAQIESNQSEALKKKIESASASKDDTELRGAAEQFEAVFINMMLKTMRTTIPEGQGFIEKSNATQTYESMLDEKMADGMAEGGGFGLSDMIYKSLVKRAAIEELSQNSEVESIDAADVDVKEKDKNIEITAEEV